MRRSLRVTFNQPTPELISFCETLTGVIAIAIAILTEEPLDAPLKGFPPNQPNLISAIATWLTELSTAKTAKISTSPSPIAQRWSQVLNLLFLHP